MLTREVALTYVGEPVETGAQLTEPKHVRDLIVRHFGHETRERFIAVHLDGRHRPIGFTTVSLGTLTASLVHPRETFRAGIQQGAASIILAHNHPSGDPTPSPEDRAVTDRLVEAGRLLGIKVLDHIVIGDGYVSLREEGAIQ